MITIKRWIFIIVAAILMLPTLGAVAQDDNPVWLPYETGVVSLRVPPTWISLSDTTLLEQTLEDMKESNPEMVPMMQQAEALLANNTISLFLIDFLTQYNLNIAILPGAGQGYTLETLDAALPGEYARMGIDLLDTEIVELPLGEALQLRSNLSVNAPTGGTATVGQYQYFVIMGNDAYVLTLTAPGADFENAEPLFRRIANTLAIEDNENAWTRHADRSNSVSLQTPTGWTPNELTEENNFDLMLSHEKTGILVVSVSETELTLSELETEFTTSLDPANIKLRNVEYVFLPAGEFIRFQLVNTTFVPFVQEEYYYITVNKGQRVTVLFSVNQDDFATVAPGFEQVMDTLQLTNENQE
jgi:hypothetical protein